MIKAAIFDLDDTLISEMEYIISGYRYIARLLSDKVGINVQAIFNILMGLFQISSKNVFNRLLNEFQIPSNENNIMELVQAYRNHEPDIRFYPDVLPCLEILKAKDIKTGIITDGYISTQRNKLKHLNADEYFDHIIVTEELGREYWKPHPMAFELMSKTLKVEFDEMIFVGDNPEKDFYIGTVYPIKTVRILRENSVYQGKAYLDDKIETYNICTMLELIELCQ